VDAQEMHDRHLPELGLKELQGSKDRLEALLAEKGDSSSPLKQSKKHDPVALAMMDNPGLTRESAEKMAAAFGF
jgi:hypothetical protein